MPGREELDELIDLVEIVLGGDVVFAGVWWARELEHCGESYWTRVERDDPDGEDLVDGYVEEEVCFVEC